MNDTSSNNEISMETRVTKVGEAISEGVQSATVATAAVAGHAQTIVLDGTAATTAAANQAAKLLSDSGETAERAWSQAGAKAEDVVDAGRRATSSVSRQIPQAAIGGRYGGLRAWLYRGCLDAPRRQSTAKERLMIKPIRKRLRHKISISRPKRVQQRF